MSDLLKRGSAHYKHGGIQPIEFILANRLGFSEGCIVKYATRWNRIGAGGIKDLRKIIHYAEFLIEQAKKDGFVNEEAKDDSVPNLPPAPSEECLCGRKVQSDAAAVQRVCCTDGPGGPRAQADRYSRERCEFYLRHP